MATGRPLRRAPRGLLAPQPQLPRFLQVTPGLGAPHTPSRGLSPPAELARLPLGRLPLGRHRPRGVPGPLWKADR